MGTSDGRRRRRICGAALPGVVRRLQGRGVPAHDINHLLALLTLREVPPFFQQTYGQLCQALNVAASPQLYFADTAFNMYAFHTEGIIVVGVNEIVPLVAELSAQTDASLGQELLNHYYALYQRLPTEAELYGHFGDLVLSLILAHELGHALQANGVSMPYTDLEASADYVAGRACFLLGMPKGLGELLFYDLGCIGDHCDHPPPAQRRSAFDTGYDKAYAEAARRATPPNAQYQRRSGGNGGAAWLGLGALAVLVIAALAGSKRA